MNSERSGKILERKHGMESKVLNINRNTKRDELHNSPISVLIYVESKSFLPFNSIFTSIEGDMYIVLPEQNLINVIISN
jgi:hypothetical protein